MGIKIKPFTEKIIAVLLIFYCVFFPPFIELQLSIFKELKISYTGFRLAILMIVLFYIFAVKGLRLKSKYHKFILPVLLSCSISFIFGIIRYGISEALGVYTNNLLFLFVIYTFGSENKSIKLGKIFKILYLYGIINAVFCICQFALKSTILPDYILNGESVYQANTYYGTFVRSSGFFFSGLDVGILLVFTLSYLIVLDCGLLIKKILVSGLLIFAIYTTKTRNVYLLLLYLNLYFFIFHTNKIQTNNKIKFFMIITTIISIIVVFFASFAGEGKLINNIFSGNSSVIRLLSWGKWVEKFMAQNPIIILFGNCSSQRLGLTTDNMYMDYLSSFGLIGLILLIRLFIKIMKLLAVRISKKSYIMTSFITCLFPFGVINLPATFFMIYLPFLTTVCIEESNDKPDNEVN